MAKPIEATPVLTGKDAERFIKNMIKTQKRKPTKFEIQMANQIKAEMTEYMERHIKENKDPWKCGCNICMGRLASVF